MARYTTTGGSRHDSTNNIARDPPRMFDNDFNTLWVSGVTSGAKVKVTFNDGIYFQKLDIIKRIHSRYGNT